MTGRRIKAIVKECCGVDCEVTFGSSRLVIDIPLYDDMTSSVNLIREAVNHYTMPAHIAIDVYLSSNSKSCIRNRMVWQDDEIFELKEATL